MDLEFLMELGRLLIYPCITIFLLYVLNMKFSYKVKLIKLIGSTSNYKVLLVVVCLIALTYFVFFSDRNAFRNPIFVSIYFAYFYLLNIPKELR